MKFAIIGSAHGHIMEFIDDMLNMGGEFIGVYNDGLNLVSKISEKYNVKVYENMDEIFEQGIQIVGTSTINNEKIDIIEECSRRGVHVMADKPIVVNEEQYSRLEKVIEKGNIEVGLMLTVRFESAVYSIKKLIDQGIIGKLLSVEIFNPHQLKPEQRPDWHFEKDKNGGVVVDLIVHSVDVYNWLTGSEIIDYTGVATKSILKEKENFYDSSQFFVTSKSGTTGYFRVDWHMSSGHWSWGDIRIFCTGSNGCLEARVIGDALTQEPMVVLYEEGKETRRLELEDSQNSPTIDLINRINKKDYIITHKDILETSRLSLEFDKNVKKINLID